MNNNILLVEDDPLNVIIFKKLLEKRGGFQVINTEDVDEILDLCQKQIISLVIMDISLAQSAYQGKFVDGIEITRLLKNNHKTKNIPVILTTAHAMRGDSERFLKESGADGYISKPVTDHEGFVNTIKSLAKIEMAE